MARTPRTLINEHAHCIHRVDSEIREVCCVCDHEPQAHRDDRAVLARILAERSRRNTRRTSRFVRQYAR